jgi:hypothetical protein
MFRLPKIAVFFLVFALLFLKVENVQAQTPISPTPTPDCSTPSPEDYYQIFNPSLSKWLDNQRCTREADIKDKNIHIQVDRQVSGNLVANLNYLTLNLVPIAPDLQASENTALGTIAKAMDALYDHPPASGIAYTRDVLANAGLLAKPAYAQGIGFAGLAPLLPIWTVMRNIAYAVIVLVMVVIGFMIIFRMKIDPKTVISVQMALPKIVVALILITFSYAIVGFMIDLMYLVMAIAINVFLNATGIYDPAKIADYQEGLMTGGVFHMGDWIFHAGFSGAGKFIWSIAGGAPIATATGVITGLLWFLSGPMGLLGIIGVPALIGVIIALGLLFTFIRLVLLLFNSYLQLLIAVILGPLQLLTEAIPGKSAFGDWIKNIIANLVVFPATALVILLATYLANLPTEQSFWMPPFVGVTGKTTYETNAFNGFLSLVLIFIAPTLVASVKKLFKPKPALPVSAGTIMAPVTGSTQTVMGAASQFYYMAQFGQMAKGLFGGGGGGGGGSTHKT